jgi:hypothetical protein
MPAPPDFPSSDPSGPGTPRKVRGRGTSLGAGGAPSRIAAQPAGASGATCGSLCAEVGTKNVWKLAPLS